MPETKNQLRFAFLRNKPAKAVSIVLAAQIVLFYAIPTREKMPLPPPLEQFSNNVGPWVMTAHRVPDAYTQSLLQADDTLDRDYAGPNRVELFVAFFKTQRAGITPHSPKMCLPANGWAEVSSGMTYVQVPGENAAIPVNRYIVTKDEQRRLVLYWFQNSHRVTANEYLSKFYLVYDSLRYRRSDEAMIRVVTDFNSNAERQEENAVKFIQAVYEPLKQQIWSMPVTTSAVADR